jgi:hypothetical protein
MPNREHNKIYLERERGFKAGVQHMYAMKEFLIDVKAGIGSVLQALKTRKVSNEDLRKVAAYVNREEHLSALQVLNMLFEKYGFYTKEALLVILLLRPWKTYLLYWRLHYNLYGNNTDPLFAHRVKLCITGWTLVEHWNDCHLVGGSKMECYSDYIHRRKYLEGVNMVWLYLLVRMPHKMTD